MASVPDFVHLHQHSTYSRFDGFSSLGKIVQKAKENEMRAVGLTDHGTIAGVLKFVKTCREENVKPIIGCEFYMARDHLAKTKEEQPDQRRGNRHLNVFAKDFNGYKNLCRLAQIASVDGYYYDPRIDFELLQEHSDGLIVSSACLNSLINWNLSIGKYDAAKKVASYFKDVFQDDFYLEVMYHGLDKEAAILPLVQKLGRELDIKLIATNDNHYTNPEDGKFHEILVCMSTNRNIKDPRRIKFPYHEFYFKSKEEMAHIFGHIPSSLTNTVEVAEKCDYSNLMFVEEGGDMRLPSFEIPNNVDSYKYLCTKSWEGLKRLGLDKSEPHIQRLKQELSDIKLAKEVNKYDFDIYMLIVADIIERSREKNIPCGIRGSGCGSLILYSLGITEGIDPIEFDLLWERFLGFDHSYFIKEYDFD